MSNIFDVVPDSEIVTIDDNVDYVTELVGEGKKFKDVSGLARGKYEADKTIDVLKTQLDELRKELNTRTSLDAFLDQMKSPKEPAPQPNPQPGVQPPAALDDSALEAKLAEILQQREQKAKAETNFEQVTRVLSEQFGDQAQLVINHKAKEVGMSVDALKNLATQSPSAFYRLVGVEPSRASDAPVVPRNAVNTVAGLPNTGVKNNAYFEKLKRTDPKKYFSQETTVEMIRARTQLGPKFYE